MDFAAARRNMVDSQVRPNDVTDLRIQNALLTTPRERFLPNHLQDQAYVEHEVSYATDRRLMRARDFAKLLAIAAPEPDDLVLNVVCGSGYSTAILAQLTGMVVALEQDEALASKAEASLAALDINNVAVVQAEAPSGLKEQGPYDLIFVDSAVGTRPEGLLEQLKGGGRLATIHCADGASQGVLYRRVGDAISEKAYFDAACRYIQPGFEKKPEFRF